VEAKGGGYINASAKPEGELDKPNIKQQDKERRRTGGSSTFILPPSTASIFMYVSSSANYREGER
jgi:hypothetical protein